MYAHKFNDLDTPESISIAQTEKYSQQTFIGPMEKLDLEAIERGLIRARQERSQALAAGLRGLGRVIASVFQRIKYWPAVIGTQR